MPNKLVILDVGHGNAAAYLGDDAVVIVDCGETYTLAEFLEGNEIDHVDTIFISHADKDHLKGILYLLEGENNVRIDTVYVNPAQKKNTDLWRSFCTEVKKHRNGKTRLVTALTPDSPGQIAYGTTLFDVLSPPPEMVAQENNDNRWSAVIKISNEAVPVAIFAGDMDRTALDLLLASGRDMNARILVFPHHGGRPGNADPAKFARDLAAAVEPSITLFSNGRYRFDNPLQVVVNAVQEVAERHHRVACTQLAESCSSDTHPNRDVDASSAGRGKGNCCLGSLVVDLPPVPDRGKFVEQVLGPHQVFVDSLTARGYSPKCRQSAQTQGP